MEPTFSTTHLLITNENFRSAAKKYISEQWNVDIESYPHISWFGDEESTLKIATVRNLQEHLSFAQTPERPHYVLILGIDTATIPAQNALLKIVEEPPANTQLLLLGHELTAVLPTIQSRCLITTTTSENLDTTEAAELYSQLVGADIPTALSMAENYTDRATAQTLAQVLIAELHQQLEEKPSEKLNQDIQTVLALKTQLDANCNVQLVVEKAFLQLI